MTAGNFGYFLPQLARHRVQFVLIGGGAAIAQGLAYTTYDVDIVYSRDQSNLERIVEALKDINLYYRGAPPGLPFRWDVQTLRNGLNFTLISDKGDLDLLGEVAGNGVYESLQKQVDLLDLYGHEIRVVNLARLIDLKRAAGRPKDFEIIAQLEALQEERTKLQPPSP